MKGSEKIWNYFNNGFKDAIKTGNESDIPSIRQASKDLDIERSTIKEHLTDYDGAKELQIFTRDGVDKNIPVPAYASYFIQNLDRDIILEIKLNLKSKRNYLKGMIHREPTVEEVAESFGKPMTKDFDELFRIAVSDTEWRDPSKTQIENGREKLQKFVREILPTTLQWSKNRIYEDEHSKELVEWKEKYSEKLNYNITNVVKMSDNSQDLAKVFVEVENPIGKFMKEPHFSVIANPVDGYWEHR